MKRLKQLNLLLTLENRREKDLITAYKVLRRLEKWTKKLTVWDTRESRGHGRKMKKEQVFTKRWRLATAWEKVVHAMTVHDFQAKFQSVFTLQALVRGFSALFSSTFTGPHHNIQNKTELVS